jgi:hypothetical protein
MFSNLFVLILFFGELWSLNAEICEHDQNSTLYCSHMPSNCAKYGIGNSSKYSQLVLLSNGLANSYSSGLLKNCPVSQTNGHFKIVFKSCLSKIDMNSFGGLRVAQHSRLILRFECNYGGKFDSKTGERLIKDWQMMKKMNPTDTNESNPMRSLTIVDGAFAGIQVERGGQLVVEISNYGRVNVEASLVKPEGGVSLAINSALHFNFNNIDLLTFERHVSLYSMNKPKVNTAFSSNTTCSIDISNIKSLHIDQKTSNGIFNYLEVFLLDFSLNFSKSTFF